MREIAKQLQTKFRAAAIEPDRLFLLRSGDAIRLLLEASGLGLELAGVEGFLITPEGAFQPRQELSNDAADVEAPLDEFVKQTILLMESGREANVAFEVVFEGLGNLANV